MDHTDHHLTKHTTGILPWMQALSRLTYRRWNVPVGVATNAAFVRSSFDQGMSVREAFLAIAEGRDR